MKKILLINPDSDSLAWYRNTLNRGGLRIFTAATAKEGLSIHREEKVNLVITELDLPDMGGDELCVRIRRDLTLRKVSVIVACNDMQAEIRRVDTCGANARLLKPVAPEQLYHCLEKLLEVPTRHDCRVLVRTRVYGERGATTLFCTSRNISVTGLLLESDDFLAVGDRISCMFFLPGPKQLTVVGEVTRAARTSRLMHQYGVRFVSLYPDVRMEIEKFVGDNPKAA
jgi:DNA-binding response OmpR family regulator